MSREVAEVIRFSENDLFLIQHSAWLINSVVVVGPLTPRNNGCKLLYVTSKHLRRKSFAARYDTDENVIPRTLAPESWYIRRISKRTIGGNRFECRINLIVSSRAWFYSSLTWRISFFLRGILWEILAGKYFTQYYNKNIINSRILQKMLSILTSWTLSKYWSKYEIKISIVFMIYRRMHIFIRIFSRAFNFHSKTIINIIRNIYIWYEIFLDLFRKIKY